MISRATLLKCLYQWPFFKPFGTRKNGPRKNGPQKNGPREKWSLENWFPEKCPSKIVLRQKNAREFKRLFHFYQLIPLHTQKNFWRLRHDPTYVANCRTLKETRKICCRVLGFHRLIKPNIPHTHTTMLNAHSTIFCFRVLGFHRLITSQHSTHTHTPRCSTPTPRFFVSEFPGDHFSRAHFSGIHVATLTKKNINKKAEPLTLISDDIMYVVYFQ